MPILRIIEVVIHYRQEEILVIIIDEEGTEIENGNQEIDLILLTEMSTAIDALHIIDIETIISILIDIMAIKDDHHRDTIMITIIIEIIIIIIVIERIIIRILIEIFLMRK